LPGRRRRLDGPGGRNVIGGDGIAENPERAGSANFFDLAWCHRKIFEERRLVDVVAVFIPLVDLAGTRGNFIPLRILPGEVAVEPAENFRGEGRLHGIADLGESRPKITEIDFLAVGAASD